MFTLILITQFTFHHSSFCLPDLINQKIHSIKIQNSFQFKKDLILKGFKEDSFKLSQKRVLRVSKVLSRILFLINKVGNPRMELQLEEFLEI